MQSDLAWKILSSWILVFQFDGSFRPPKDPGYPTVAAKMATCAACFFFESEEGNKMDSIALGARSLSFAMDMTSAHAEYEGLLLGLEWLTENTPSSLLSLFSDQQRNLVIQGDCKTVIDQLSGKSISRKLQKKHEQATEFLTEIMPHFETIDFVHIPRKHNALCDNLCSNTMVSLESFAYQQCCNDLDDVALDEGNPTSMASTFQRYILSDKSLIRHSLQPFLLATMLQRAEEQEDYESTVKIGQHVFKEAKQFTTKKDAEKLWRAIGVVHHVNGLRGIGEEKKAAASERKHRILLSSYKANALQNLMKPAEKPTFVWDSTIAENWDPLLQDWSQHAAQERSWTQEMKGSTIWSQSQPLKRSP